MADNCIQVITKMKVADLKKELKSRGLSCIGNKTDLMDRLQSAIENESGKGDALSTEELIDDALNDEDLDEDIDEDVDAEKSLDLDNSIIIRENETLIPSVNTAKPLKRKSIDSSTEDTSFPKIPPKKIVLNRALSVPTSPQSTEPVKNTLITTAPTIDSISNPGSEEKKVIKLSNLTAKERLEMRAKKFGTPLTVDQKKEARIERFGSTGNNNSKIGSVHTKIDVLKKRAERFGGSVSTEMSKIDLEERLEKRKARFGVPTTTTKKGTTVK